VRDFLESFIRTELKFHLAALRAPPTSAGNSASADLEKVLSALSLFLLPSFMLCLTQATSESMIWFYNVYSKEIYGTQRSINVQ